MSKKTETKVEEQAPQAGAAPTRPETAKEMAQRLTKEVELYKELVDTKNTQEELDELEKSLMSEMDEFDKYIKERVYNLPTSCTFEGKSYTRSDVATKIVYFISKIEQTWQYVLGLYELCKLWKADVKDISYGALDSTLRLLDQCKFRGTSEWRDILIVNEYIKPLHEDYAKDTTMQIARAQMHDAIIKRRDLIVKIEPENTDAK